MSRRVSDAIEVSIPRKAPFHLFFHFLLRKIFIKESQTMNPQMDLVFIVSHGAQTQFLLQNSECFLQLLHSLNMTVRL